MYTWRTSREQHSLRCLSVTARGFLLLLAIFPTAGLRAQEEESAIVIEPEFPGGGLLGGRHSGVPG